MTHRIGARIKEQASTTGTGAFTFTGALAGFKSFASKLTADGDTTWYCAINGDEWEEGVGTRTGAATMSRAVIASSNGDALVNFTAAPIVFCDLPAAAFNVTSPDSPGMLDAADDEFEAAALDTGGTRRSGATAWATLNPTGVTFSQAAGALQIAAPSNGGAEGLKAAEQVLPGSGTWKYRAKLWGTWASYNVNASIGLSLRNTTNSKVVLAAKQRNPTAPCDYVAVFKFTSPTVYNSAYLAPADALTLGAGPASSPGYFEAEWDGTNYNLRLSPSGLPGSFRTLATFTPADFLGTADRIGICVAPVSQAATVHCEWFKRVA